MSAQTHRSSHLFSFVLSISLLIAAAAIFVFRQQILDQINISRFTPSPSIAAIDQKVSFTDHGTFLFYASRPELLERDAFNGACRSSATEQSAVLGCYANQRIFLFNIENKQLDGVKEVTAAHEMLHAAYERLSPTEKTRVNALIEKQSFGDSESRINDLMQEYARTEPGERLNELHSILGTELASLSPELESYYAQYFKDRSKVVAFASTYQSVFDELKQKQDTLVNELNELADQIDRDGAIYKRNLQVLSADVESFNDRASSGTMTREQYNTERSRLENRQDALRSDYTKLQATISDYENKRSELSAINSQSNALNRSINSSVSPVPDGIDG